MKCFKFITEEKIIQNSLIVIKQDLAFMERHPMKEHEYLKSLLLAQYDELTNYLFDLRCQF